MWKLISFFIIILPIFVYGTIPVPNNFDSRLPGQSLDGYWVTNKAPGCMKNDAILVIKEDVIYRRFLKNGKIKPWADIELVKFSDKEIIFSYTIKKSKTKVRNIISDRGNRLFRKYSYVKKTKYKSFKKDRHPARNYTYFLKRCNVHSFAGNLSHNLGVQLYDTLSSIENEISNL